MKQPENSAEIRPRRRRWGGLAAGAFLALSAFAPAVLADTAPPIDVGHSAYVLNTVNGQAPQARPVVIRLNDKIVFQEEVAAGRQAKTTIEFRDGSLFSLGPDARARIDSFVFDPRRSTSHKALAVTRGVFRYLSGFAARDKEAKIELPSGTLGIRGSLVVGVVAAGAPDFLFVAQGKAVFTNDAGSVVLVAGQGIAILSRHDHPMNPKRMPPAIAAQVLRAILKLLPSSKTLLAETGTSTAQLIAEGKANLRSALRQERLEREHQGHGGHDGSSAKGGSIAAAFPLLVKAEKLGLFGGKHGGHKGEQILFLAKIGHGSGADAAYLHGLVKAAKALHHDNAERALRVVGHGVALVTLIGAENNPKAAARLLQRAIDALRINSAAAGHLVGLFSDAVAETESCDPEEAKALAKELHKVLSNPKNADLLAYVPTTDVTTDVTQSGPPAPGGQGPPGPNGPTSSAGAFGSFGSSAGSGVSTSPAS